LADKNFGFIFGNANRIKCFENLSKIKRKFPEEKQKNKTFFLDFSLSQAYIC